MPTLVLYSHSNAIRFGPHIITDNIITVNFTVNYGAENEKIPRPDCRNASVRGANLCLKLFIVFFASHPLRKITSFRCAVTLMRAYLWGWWWVIAIVNREKNKSHHCYFANCANKSYSLIIWKFPAAKTEWNERFYAVLQEIIVMHPARYCFAWFLTLLFEHDKKSSEFVNKRPHNRAT